MTELNEMLTEWVQKSRRGLITDVDGTISPIVDTPDAAQVTSRAKSLLRELVDTLELVAVISGRGAPDVQARVGVEGITYVGNHGMERWRDGSVEIPESVRAYRPAMEIVRDHVQHYVDDTQQAGILVEDKNATLSVHYRKAANPDEAATTLRKVINAVSEENGLHVHEGRMLFEIRPPLQMNKGTALRDLAHEFELDALIYIGDDTTDVDAIHAARELRTARSCFAYGIGVTADETPQLVIDSADFLVSSVSGVESLFESILSAARASSS